jgi:potassium inwardly-rectifying channel subfamily J
MTDSSRLLGSSSNEQPKYDSVEELNHQQQQPNVSFRYYEDEQIEDGDIELEGMGDDTDDDEGDTIMSPSRPFHNGPPGKESVTGDINYNTNEIVVGSASYQNMARMDVHQADSCDKSQQQQQQHEQNQQHQQQHNRNHHGFRMVDRDGDFHQSRGKISVRKRMNKRKWRSLYSGDMFHSLVNAPTMRTVGILLFVYFLIIVIFAVFYYLISRVYDCNMGIESFEEAFLFSLESMATVGYGTQDIFFDDCILPMVVLTAQMMVRIVCDAGVIGVIYARLARPTTRASTILFSNFAIIRRVRGKLYLMFQLCELRKHHLVEAHVRLYVIRQDRYNEGDNSTIDGSNPVDQANPVTENVSGDTTKVHFQTSSLRLNHPNDDLGSMLLMCLPQVVVHEIDASSTLMPPPRWQETLPMMRGQKPVEHRWAPPAYQFAETENHRKGEGLTYEPAILNNLGFPSVSQKNPYNFVNTRELTESGMAGLRHGERVHSTALHDYADHFNNPPPQSDFYESKRNKVEESEKNAKRSGAYDDETESHQEERRMVQTYMRDRRMEIVAVVEGLDATTGGVVQARHSFVCDDIKWNRSFVPCVHEEDEEGVAVIDFSVFHKLRKVPSDSPFSGVIASAI